MDQVIPPLESARAQVRYRPSVARLIILVVAGVVAVSQWVRVLYAPGGDFALHWAFGHRFVAGEFLYHDDFTDEAHTPYPPFWGLASAPLSIVPMPTAHALLYPASLVALAVLTTTLARLTRRSLPLSYPAAFWAAAAAMALASRFLIRELPECGPNLVMVALAWIGFALWRDGRETSGGAALGLAIALKCTPALFVAYFALKRQWRMVATSTAFAIGFTLAPALWMGPASYKLHMATWAGNVLKGVSEPDPTVGVLGQEEVKNHALRPVLGRYLVRLPAGHLGRLDSRWRLEGLGVAPRAAGLIVKAVTLALVVGVGLAFRRRLTRRDDPAAAWEAAAVSVLILLLSPITWRQHCVGAYPALYLIARTAVARRGLPAGVVAMLAIYATLVLVLDRGLIGREWTLVLDSYGATTWGLVLVLAVALWGRRRAIGVEAGSVPRPHLGAVAVAARSGLRSG